MNPVAFLESMRDNFWWGNSRPSAAKPGVMLVGGPDVDARLDLMRAIANHFDVSAAGSEPELETKFSKNGFEYFTYPLRRRVDPLSDFRSLIMLVKLFRRVRPLVVHTFDTKPNVWGRIAARLAGVPVVVGTITGIGSLYADESLPTRLVRKVYKSLQSLACHLSDLTIFQNHDDLRYFLAERLAPEEKTTIILSSGVSTDQFSPSCVSQEERDHLRAELGLETGDMIVTMVSRIIRSKGVLEYLSAAQETKARHPNTHFLLVGQEDPESMDHLTSVEMDRLRQSVTCTGQRSDIPAIMAISDIFVLPSAYREGVPRVLLEAAAMGLPLVTTDSPGCNEVVKDGWNGYLIPVGDAAALNRGILRLLEHPELRRQFGLSSRQWAVECFDLAIISAQIAAVYQRLLERRGLAPVQYIPDY